MTLWLDSLANQSHTYDTGIIGIRVHQAYFLIKPEEHCFFVNVVNSSPTTDIEITHVWYEGSTRVDILEPRRPLPQRLRPNESWETWIRSAEVPDDPDPFTNFRVRISNGKVFNSEQNRNVPSRGFVPGGKLGQNNAQVAWLNQQRIEESIAEHKRKGTPVNVIDS